MDFPGGSVCKQNLPEAPEMQEIQVPSLSLEDPLEESVATHSQYSYSWLENPMDRGAWKAPSRGSHGVRHDWSDWTELNI